MAHLLFFCYCASKNVNGNTAVFTYDGTKLLTEQTDDTTKTNIYGTGLIATAGSDVLYYQYNNHGDVISVLDQSGTVKNEYDYDAFGNAITEKETVSNPYRYAGYYQDSESGLYYLQSRYYNPRTARFLTEDTASGKYTDPLSLNNWKQVAGNAAEGAVTGAIGAATGGTSLAASAAGTVAKTGVKTVAKNVAQKVAANVVGNAAGNVANQAISKGVKNISAKEAAVAGAAGILDVAGDVAGDAAGVALKKAGSKAVSKIVGAVGERAGAVAAKKAGAKAAQKTMASSAAAGVVGAGADAIPEGKIASAVGGENVYDLLKRKGIPSTLSDEEIAAAKAVDLRMQAGKKSISGTVGKSGSSSIDTPINSGVSRPRDVATPNSIYEQMNPDRTVKSRAFYAENGNQFSRQDFDHRHYDKKTKQYYQPHEHNYSYNEKGQPIGKSDRSLPKGYSNKPTN